MRWQTEKEVKDGKGQFKCGAKRCEETDNLRTWEVNFAYEEPDGRKNALVKVRLCTEDSYRLNYHHQKKDVTKRGKRRVHKTKKAKKKHRKRSHSPDSSVSDSEDKNKMSKKKSDIDKNEIELEYQASEIWRAPIQLEQERSREEDFSEYLEDLFL